MDNGFRALQGALGGFDSLARDLTALLVSSELHEASSDDLGQMALLVALGNLDGFGDLAVAQRASHCRSELPGLVTSGVEGHPAIDHDAAGPATAAEEDYDDGAARD